MITSEAFIIFLLLAATIFCSFVSSIALLRRTRLFAFPIGIFFIYYWSLRGAWYITIDEIGGDSGLSYQYLFDKLFSFRLDWDYVVSVVYYSLFVVTIQLVLIVRMNKAKTYSAQVGEERYRINHMVLLSITSISFAASYAIFGEDLGIAVEMDRSGYVLTRASNIPLFTTASILNRMACIPLGIGFAVLCSGAEARHIVGSTSWKRYLAPYVFLMSLFFVYASALGNKNELLVALTTGVLFYLINCPRPRKFALLGLALSGMLLIAMIDILRGIPLARWQQEVSFATLADAWQIPFHSNEMFGAHISLYGVLSTETPIKFGYSFYSLACSVVPRFLWPDRPADIYEYYAESVKAVAGQGYAIHHATGWYLNFGVLGIFIGGATLALVWSWLTNGFYTWRKHSSHFTRLFFLLVPWTFVAGIPVLLRGGPEAYKGLIMDCVFAPLLVCFFAVSGKLFRAERGVRIVAGDLRRGESLVLPILRSSGHG